MTAVAVGAPGAELLAPGYRTVGLVPVLGGVLLHRAGTRRFAAAGTTVEPDGVPSALVENGVFALTRNPMYLAGVVILSGVGLLLGGGAPLVLVPVWALAATRWYIRAEEEALAARFGAVYGAYRSRVRRWL